MTARYGEAQIERNANVVSRRRVNLADAGDVPLQTTAGVGAVPNALLIGGTVAVAEYGDGTVHKTVLTLAAFQQAITDALAYGSSKLYDFPEGRILVLGATSSLAFAVTTDRATTINDSASLTWALGSAAASNITLSATMVDLLPKTTKALAGAVDAFTTASTAALAASAQFDGTGTAKDAYLNFGFETNTEIDGNGTLSVSGTITIAWMNLGDY